MSVQEDFQKYLIDDDSDSGGSVYINAIAPLGYNPITSTLDINSSAIITTNAQTWTGKKRFINGIDISDSSEGSIHNLDVDSATNGLNITTSALGNPSLRINKDGGFIQSTLNLHYTNVSDFNHALISNSSGLTLSPSSSSNFINITDNGLYKVINGSNQLVNNFAITDLTTTLTTGNNFRWFILSGNSSSICLGTSIANYSQIKYTQSSNDLDLIVYGSGNINIDNSNNFNVQNLRYTGATKKIRQFISTGSMLTSGTFNNLSNPMYIQLSDTEYIDFNFYNEQFSASTTTATVYLWYAAITSNTDDFIISYRLSHFENNETNTVGSSTNVTITNNNTTKTRKVSILSTSISDDIYYSLKISHNHNTYTNDIKIYGVTIETNLYGW